MAHGENAKKRGHAGKEYWKSRHHKHGEVPGRFTKTITHRKERREGTPVVRGNCAKCGVLITEDDDVHFYRSKMYCSSDCVFASRRATS